MKRLHTEYLDVLLLHRPDELMEPEEAAEAIGLTREEWYRLYLAAGHPLP